MTNEIEKIKYNSEKLKSKLEKGCYKQTKKFLNTVKDIKQSKSASNLDKIVSLATKLDKLDKAKNTSSNSSRVSIIDINNNQDNVPNKNCVDELETRLKSANEDMYYLVYAAREKYSKTMISVYEELYKNMKIVKLQSIQSVNF